MYVHRYLLFVPYPREMEPAPLLVGCVCFPSPLLHEKQNADERIFLRTRKKEERFMTYPSNSSPTLLPPKRSITQKIRGLHKGISFTL